MVSCDDKNCPACNGELKYYDRVKRTVRTKGRKTWKEWVRRMRCTNKDCRKLHRALPDSILPYKQYEAEVIFGVLEGWITPDTLGYEDYPCETTMKRWTAQKEQGLL